jgi:hypothetical protein
VYTAIEGSDKTGGKGSCHHGRSGIVPSVRFGCGLAELHQHRFREDIHSVRGDMAHLDDFASRWEMSPPKRNPDDVGFDEMEDDVADDEDDDLEDEDDEEEDEDDEEDEDLDVEDVDEEDLEDEEDLDDDDLDEDLDEEEEEEEE